MRESGTRSRVLPWVACEQGSSVPKPRCYPCRMSRSGKRMAIDRVAIDVSALTFCDVSGLNASWTLPSNTIAPRKGRSSLRPSCERCPRRRAVRPPVRRPRVPARPVPRPYRVPRCRPRSPRHRRRGHGSAGERLARRVVPLPLLRQSCGGSPRVTRRSVGCLARVGGLGVVGRRGPLDVVVGRGPAGQQVEGVLRG